MSSELGYQPVVIIGAARSGTNMLRDMLTQISGVATWPCDEINYIWRHGNTRHATDELTPRQATPAVRQYIRKQFDKLAQQTNCKWLLEKTCANSLRVEFVNEVLSDAKYVFIVRDGRDVTLSALKRWKASLDITYILRKARYVPPSDLPYYAGRYLSHRLHRLYSAERRLTSWGPRIAGMDELLRQHPLDEVCMLQWQRSVELAHWTFCLLPTDRVHSLRYEDVVREPRKTLESLTQFLGMEASAEQINRIADSVFIDSLGAWKKRMPEEQRSRLENLAGDTLRRFRYELSTAEETQLEANSRAAA